MSRITIILSFFLACLGTNIQAKEPYWEQTRGPAGMITKLVFDKNENMYAIGQRVWYSANEGVTWIDITPKESLGLFSAISVSPEGIVYLGEGAIQGTAPNRYAWNAYRSDDKGKSWQIIQSFYITTDIKADTGGIVYLAGHSLSNYKDNFLISYDNGTSWSLPQGFDLLPKLDPFHISLNRHGHVFLDYNYAKDPFFYRSTDKGQNWTKLINNNVGGYGLIYGIDDKLYVPHGYFSTDNGRTWESGGFGGDGIAELVSGEAYTFSDYQVHYTSNIGTSWKTIYQRHKPLNGVLISTNYSRTKVFMVVNNGICLMSPDSSKWVNRDIPCGQVTALLTNVSGRILAATAKTINYTTGLPHFVYEEVGLASNIGNEETWKYEEPQYVDPQNKRGGIWRFGRDSSNGILATKDEEIYRSTDNCVTWKILKSALPATIIRTAPNGSIFAINLSKELFRTSDMGASWDMLTGFGARKVAGVDVNNNGNIFVGAGGAVFLSANNGDTWEDLIDLSDRNSTFLGGPMLSASITSIVHSATGNIIAGYQGELITDSTLTNFGYKYSTVTKNGIIVSSDNGATWINMNDGLSNDVFSDLVSGPSGEIYGLASRPGLSGKRVFYKHNDDTKWINISSGLGDVDDIACITVGKDGIAYIGTSGRGVFRKGKVVNSVDDTNQPTQHTSVLAVYPNPVASHTSIAYSLRDNSYVELSLFDALGREIVNYVKKSQIAGDYQVDANLFNLDAGIYFVKLVTSHGSVVEKVIVTK